MTLIEMYEVLEGMIEDYGENTELRIASQPAYPFEYSIRGIVGSHDDPVLSQYDDPINPDDESAKVWIVEGSQLGYFTKDAWNLC